MKFNYLLMIAVSLTMIACGFEPGDSDPVQESPSKTNTTQQRLTTLQLGLEGTETKDAAGATHQFETLKFHVKHIELDLPAGMSCEDIPEALVGARCQPVLADGTEVEIEIEAPHNEEGEEDEDEAPHNEEGEEDEDEVPHNEEGEEDEDEVPHNEEGEEDEGEGEEDEGEEDEGEEDEELPHTEDEEHVELVLGKIVIDGPFVVDLNEGTPARLRDVLIPDLAYARVDIRITPDKSNLLDGRNSLIMMTNTLINTEPMSVKVAFKFTEDMRFEASNGVRVTGGPVLVDFDPSMWFVGMDFSQCGNETEMEIGQVLIDDDSDLCDDYEGVLKKSLKTSGRLR